MFRERIKAKYDELTPSFRKLADFILQRQLDAAFMTATELAQSMDVDAATVVRFAQTLGYSGFRELIKEVQRVVKAELTASYTPDLEAPDDLELFRGILENERHNLALAQTQLTEQANAVMPALLDAQRIWVMGQGSGAHLAALCASVLRGIGLPAVSIAPDPLEAASNLKGAGADDLVIGFSVSGMDLTVADAVNFARQRGAKTLVFTTSLITAAAMAAETTIVCPGPTQTHVPSFTGLAAMIVVLFAAFTARYPERAAAMTADLQQGYRELLTFQAHSSSEVDVEELWRQF
ncbi:MAG: MurR/RpiR family transcriptional regulator [Chloroflexota bacterium]|nr:MurR/RpiR family transcriptional regulator [Chloroflexota bacterium]